MSIISDTSPINYLVLIEKQEVLRLLFGRVLMPEAIWQEPQADATPGKVRRWVASLPSYLEVKRGMLNFTLTLAELKAHQFLSHRHSNETSSNATHKERLALQGSRNRRSYFT